MMEKIFNFGLTMVLSYIFYMFTLHNVVVEETRQEIYNQFAIEGKGEFYLDSYTGKTKFRLFPCDCK